jgi:tetratricopeptide (TPR) repeat protein
MRLSSKRKGGRGVRAATAGASALAVGVTLLAGGSAALGARDAVAAPNCTAQQGQAFIDQSEYDRAIREFSCVIDAAPTEAEGYRGRMEALLLQERFSDAVGDCTRVYAFVIPVHPDAAKTIVAGYDARLAVAPESVPALTGKSFAHWCFFDYPAAIHVLNELLNLQPNDLYGNLFLGSSRVLKNAQRARGVEDLERAIALAPESPDVHFVVADAYTYGLPDPERAFAEASLAFEGGLDTPRVHAILASAYDAFGNVLAAADHIQQHIELVTTELVPAPALPSGESLTLDLVAGRTYEIEVAAEAGETISIATSSKDMWDTIAVLLAPDGTPVVGSDDANGYLAAFDWVAEESVTYRLQVTSFEAASTGALTVTRD